MNSLATRRAARTIISFIIVCTGLSAASLGQSNDSGSTRQNFALDPTKQISQYAHFAWRIQDGAMSGLPEAITQTADGYLWVGTYDGLVRFDGVKFVPWGALSKRELPDFRISSIHGARDGSLWIGTAKGLARWKDGVLTTYLKPLGRISSIVEDDAGTIWIARSQVYDDQGPLCQVSSDHLQCHGEKDGITFPSANKMVRDSSGNFWIGGPAGLNRWKPDSHEAYFQNHFRNLRGLVGVVAVAAEKDAGVWASLEGLGASLDLQHLVDGVWKSYSLPGIAHVDAGISALFIDRDHSVWVGTASHGIYRIHGDRIDHYSSGDGLSSNGVAGFYQDREGTLWVATSGGVDTFRDLRVTSYSMREGLTADSASTVLASRDRTVWIGNSGALNFIQENKVGAILTGRGLPGRDVITMFEDHAGQLWIGIDTELWLYRQGSFRPIAKGIAFSITEDSSQNIWARVGPKILRIRDLKVVEEISSPLASDAYVITADPHEGIWLGLGNGDLVRYRSGKLETFSPSPDEHHRRINALLADSDGSIFGATEEGLVGLRDGVRTRLTSRNGLPCDFVYTMVKDDAGSLWLDTKCGIVEIPAAELAKWWAQPASLVNIKILDGFDGAQPGETLRQPQATKSSDGRLWFVNASILQMVDPSNQKKNDIPPPVHVEQIIADHKTYFPGTKLELPALTSELEFDYAALSFVATPKVRYRYKLEAHDREWQDPGARRQALYNDLPPGNYKFRVIACNNDGVWNEAGATVEFGILPAFYQTTWFLLLSLSVTAYLIWAAYQWRVRYISRRLDLQFEERLAERTRIAQELHDTLLQGVLSASMQLHVANDLLVDDSPAKSLVKRVLELMKQVVNDGRNAVRGLRSSKDSPQDLDQAFSRFPQEIGMQRPVDFRVIVEGSPPILHPVIRDEVYRIGREALANAFLHSGASSIEVELEYAVHQLRLLVRDNGCGIDSQVLRSGREGHFGLSGMHERAGRIGAKLKVWSRPAGGTEVELSVPGNIAFHSRPPQGGRKWLTGWRGQAKNGTTK